MTSSPVPQRGELTDQLLAYLTSTLMDAGILVGDAIKPAEGGWPSEPQEGQFTSYVTLGTGPATPATNEPATLATLHAAWFTSYTLTSVGAVRKQADWVADQARGAALGYAPRTVELGPDAWSVELVLFSRLGPVGKDTSTDPPFWTVLDDVALRITRASRPRRGVSA